VEVRKHFGCGKLSVRLRLRLTWQAASPKNFDRSFFYLSESFGKGIV